MPTLDSDAVLWAGDPTERPLVVLLHGYGSDERDLFALREHLPAAFAYASVRAPLSPPFPMGGHSWYPIHDLSSRDPTAVTEGAAALLAWLASVGAERVGLIGFSQGGAVALQALRTEPARIGFVANLSGYAAGGSAPGDAALRESRPPVFWGRGTDDTVIPASAIEHTLEWLPAHSSLSGAAYPGLAHAVSAQELDDLNRFLERQIPG
ncbi:alpha/beta hydrolase [Microbacterium halophytorum]|uniref:alpha/beta hydrolase n=1 Tax=Microbacterium halophytorum TaxID=2067568 RepID=UPI000CFAD9C9|nr:alpha/beta fold hydrolase [Microbacterium halophytorum]